MLLAVTASLLLLSPELPEPCRAPATRDVAALSELAQRSGAVSVGLDSVATWCFESSGRWTGGASGAGAAASPEPQGDCAKALETCRVARERLGPELVVLLESSLKDLERPFLGTRYVPKRSGLSERPPESFDCSSRQRAALFAQAQARMDWARLASQAQSEYANYRTWLFAQGLRCAERLAGGVVDATRRGLAFDRALDTDAGVLTLPHRADASPGLAEGQILGPGPGLGEVADALGPSMGALEGSSARPSQPTMLTTWQALAAERAKIELDPDWVGGFLASRELRECRCVPVEPAELLRRIERRDRMTELEADAERSVGCERCLQDAFVPWKTRVRKQCLLMAKLTDFELGVLERSDDGNGLPARCFAAARAQRGSGDGGVASGGTSFIITRAPEAPPKPVTEPSHSPVPLPPREAGRTYLRLFMSATCVAEVEPGPVQLRTGDLLPVPLGASALRVRSSCGGVAEVYWGTEERPRVSETFGKNQPLELQFSR